MKNYIGDFIIAGVSAFVLTLTGISVTQQQSPIPPSPRKDIDSIMQDTKIKTFQIKTLLFQTNIRKDTIAKTKKSRVNL
jgi:hypothetical protein